MPIKALRARSFIVTLNNPKNELSDYESAAKKANAIWFTAQLEKGANGTVHVQAALGFKNPTLAGTVTKIFPGCHVERAKAPA